MMMIAPEQLARLKADRAAYESMVETQQAQAVAERLHRLARARANGQTMAAGRLSWVQVCALKALLHSVQNPFPGEWNEPVARRLMQTLPEHLVECAALSDDEAMSFLQGVADVAAVV